MLILVLTAATVVALASDTTTITPASYTKKLTPKWEEDATTDYKFIGSGGDDRTGYIYARIADDGNKYVVYTPKDFTTENASAYIDQTLTTTTKTVSDSQNEGKNKTIYQYNLVDYPYLVYDFDVMTPSGTYGGAISSFTFRAYTCKFKSATSTTRTMQDTSKSPLSVNFSAFSSHLDKTPYTWQHVTIIMEYAPKLDENGLTANANFNISIYINGKYVASATNAAASNYTPAIIGILPEDFGFYSVRMSGNKASYGTKVSTSDPSYVADDPTTHFKDHIAFDNTVISYYNAGYTDHAQIAAERYTDDYVLPYGRTVASVTDAQGTVTNYDKLEKAYAAASADDVITLYANTASPLAIDKKITVNANGYTFDYTTVGDYRLDSDANGVYTFVYDDRVVTVKWDAPCASGCSCYPNHPLTKETSVKYNEIPTYPGDINVPAVNGLKAEFLGWSYENDGTVDEITAITSAIADAGVLYLYPVYSAPTQYSFEVITSSATTYYLENEYNAAFTAVKSGGTIILHTDVNVPTSFNFNSKKAVIVFDLNGHDYTRFSYYNYHFNASYDSATGTWSKGSAISDDADPRKTVSGNDGSAFSMGASEINFTLKTSVPGSNIYTYTLYRDLWLDESGNTVGYDNLRNLIGKNNNNNGGVTFISYKGAPNSVVNIEGDGITYYGSCFVTNEYGSNYDSCTFNVNGGTYHVVLKTYMSVFSFQAGGVLNVRNATIFANGSSFVRVEDNVGSGAGNTVTKVDFTFTNCKIFDATVINNNKTLSADGIKLVDCLYYASKNDSDKLTIDSLTYTNYNALTSKLATNTATVKIEKTVSVNGIAENEFVLDENNYPTFVFTKETKEYAFTYAIADIDTDCVTVNWYDVDGYWLEKTYALKNDTLVIPAIKVPIGDGWRAVTNVTPGRLQTEAYSISI